MSELTDLELELSGQVSACYADPLRFVRIMYPWGEPGPLESYSGPDVWQAEFLEDLGKAVRERKFDGSTPVLPVRMTTASGHGIGKSTLVAWIVDWVMSTRPNCRGTLTANTFQQLNTRTWSAVQSWTRHCLTGHWFKVTSDRMYHRIFKDSWFCGAQSCKEENSEAFAGQHAADSTVFTSLTRRAPFPRRFTRWRRAV